MLTISHFEKSYNKHPVLAIDHQSFEEGSYLIQGSNGSGKTTLFRSIAGLLKFEGDIWINDEISIKKNPVKFRKYVNYCGAEPIFPLFLTAHDLSSFVAKAKKAPKRQKDELVELFDMNSFLYQPIETYSSGMIKKTSLLLGFLGQPKVILLDEPFTTIDSESLKILVSLISTHQNKCTFLISSHQLRENIPLNFKLNFTILNNTLNTQQ